MGESAVRARASQPRHKHPLTLSLCSLSRSSRPTSSAGHKRLAVVDSSFAARSLSSPSTFPLALAPPVARTCAPAASCCPLCVPSPSLHISRACALSTLSSKPPSSPSPPVSPPCCRFLSHRFLLFPLSSRCLENARHCLPCPVLSACERARKTFAFAARAHTRRAPPGPPEPPLFLFRNSGGLIPSPTPRRLHVRGHGRPPRAPSRVPIMPPRRSPSRRGSFAGARHPFLPSCNAHPLCGPSPVSLPRLQTESDRQPGCLPSARHTTSPSRSSSCASSSPSSSRRASYPSPPLPASETPRQL